MFGVCTMDKPDKIKIIHGDEITILNEINKMFHALISNGYRIAGHNIIGFDIPFLYKRFLINNIQPHRDLVLWNKKPWDISHIDTMKIWGEPVSLENLANNLGITFTKSLTPEDIHYCFRTGDIERVSNYCKEDIETTTKILNKLSDLVTV